MTGMKAWMRPLASLYAGEAVARNVDRPPADSHAAEPPLRRWLGSSYRSVAAGIRRGLEAPPPMPEEERAAILLLACGMIRGGHYEDAHALLELSLRRCPYDARCLNLMGVVCEARGDWRIARKYYGRAIAANGRLPESLQNMRRMFELFTFGDSREPIVLGDETEDGRVPVLRRFPKPAES